ncbi:hypothetical protein [Roseicyclus sediminis]|uniref:hypothetical protein n=1 Tax=Roseicyclus sediminis TaxID=2980997 RepID=UPI0021D320ED|nr:hypothetical protein [Roseibacterium sp. SDUM158016]
MGYSFEAGRLEEKFARDLREIRNRFMPDERLTNPEPTREYLESKLKDALKPLAIRGFLWDKLFIDQKMPWWKPDRP